MRDDDDEDEEYEPDDDEEPTVACQACGRAMYDDVVRCPSCGHYQTSEGPGLLADRPWWVIAAAILCGTLVLSWIAGLW